MEQQNQDIKRSRFRELWQRWRANRVFRALTNKYVVATLIFLIIIFFVDKNNVVRWASNYFEVLGQERVIRQYEKDINSMDEKLKELTSDKDSLEKFAREQYYFHEKGEDVFIVE